MSNGLLNKQQKKSIEALGKKEVKEYESNMFELENYGGSKEADALIKRYKSKITLTEKDEEILRHNAPQAPQFDILTKEQYRQNGCWKKYKYRNKVEKYFKDRKEYYTTPSKKSKKLSKGQRYALKKQELEARFAEAELLEKNKIEDNMGESIKEPVVDLSMKKKSKKQKMVPVFDEKTAQEIEQLKTEADEQLEQYKNDGLFGDIPEDPYEMDQEYENRSNEILQRNEYEEAEQKLAEKQIELINKTKPSALTMIKAYCFTDYTLANNFLRKGSMKPGYEKVIEAMKENPLKKDHVVRRAVANLSTAGFMLGLENPDEMTEEELKTALKEKFNESKLNGTEMIMTEKGFMSTSLPNATSNFKAISGSGKIGIEFIILAKKGTPAINVSTVSFKPQEKELLLAPGTKFKVLDMQLDGEANILYGKEGSWKIYLSTISESEEGIQKKVA